MSSTAAASPYSGTKMAGNADFVATGRLCFIQKSVNLVIICLTNSDLFRYDDPVPRPHEDGGKYGKGVIGREAEDMIQDDFSAKEKAKRGRDKRFCRRYIFLTRISWEMELWRPTLFYTAGLLIEIS
jgi:hypothetical protein